MKRTLVPAMAGVCGVMLFAGTASADFVMLTVELFANNWNTSDAEFDGNIPDGNLRDLWRVYAVFDDPSDRMTAIGVALDGTPMTVENVLADGVTPGSGLYVAGFSVDGPASVDDGIWTINPTGATHDTYMTIGNEAGYTPVIDPQTGDPYLFGWGVGKRSPKWQLGSSWIIDNAAMVTIPPAPYGEPDPDGRVLVAQFNVADGEHIQGFANIIWGNVGLAGGGFVTEVFFTSIPAPGTLALLGLAGLFGIRRRRR